MCDINNKFMLKYFRGYHKPTKINLHEYLPHEQFPHENFPIRGIHALSRSIKSVAIDSQVCFCNIIVPLVDTVIIDTQCDNNSNVTTDSKSTTITTTDY